MPEEAIELLWKILTQSILNKTKSNIHSLKRRERGQGKFSCAIFSTDNEDRHCKGGIFKTPLQCLSSVFLEIDEGVGQPLTINLIHSQLKDYALMEIHFTLDYG